MKYLKINDILYSHCSIRKIDCKDLEKLIIYVHLIYGEILKVEGLNAIEIVMQARPSIIEGKRFKFKKFSWMMHNLIGHPMMQMFALMRLYKVAIWIHDVTIPKPLDKK